MAKRKKPSLTQKRKESLLRQVRRMEARGYWFDEDIRRIIRDLSPQKARFFTTETLYQKARAVNAITGEPLSGIEARALERKEAARKAALTRRRRRESAPQPSEKEEPEREEWLDDQEEPLFDATEELLDRFSGLLSFFDRPISPTGVTAAGKTVPKSDKIGNYEASVKNFLRTVFGEERRKDPVALADRIYSRASDIDELIGVIDMALYLETIRIAGNKLIAIMRGTGHLSMEDRKASEDIANEEWDDV